MRTQLGANPIPIFESSRQGSHLILIHGIARKLPKDRSKLVLHMEGDTVIASEEASVYIQQEVTEFPVGVIDDGIEECHQPKLSIIPLPESDDVRFWIDRDPSLDHSGTEWTLSEDSHGNYVQA